MKNRKLLVANLNQTQLAIALDVKRQLLGRWIKMPGFPAHRVKGKKLFNLGEARQWIKLNIRRRPQSPDVTAEQLAAAPDDQNLKTLMDGTADAMAISTAAMRLAAQSVAKGAAAGALSMSSVDSLKKSLQELRNAESGYLELATKRKELIPRTDVKAIIGLLVARLIRAFENLETSVATEFAMWLVDPAVRDMPADDRNRKVRQFVHNAGRQIRQAEADGVEKLIADGAKE